MIERILADGLHFPEGPAFDRRGNLWCVELQGGGLVCWKDGTWSRISTGGAPNGIAIDRQDRVIFCDAQQMAIRSYEPDTGVFETLADYIAGEPLFKPNDLAFDASGNLLFTCPGDSRTEPTGYMCVRSSNGEMHKIGTGFYFCNGLALTPEGTELIVAETYRQRLWRGTWDASSMAWVNPRIWCEGLGGAPGPDGMAWADDGSLWVAVYGSGMVFQIGQAGEILNRLQVAGKNPTNCAIDPSGSLGLVVTEAETGRVLSYSIPHKPAIF